MFWDPRVIEVGDRGGGHVSPPPKKKQIGNNIFRVIIMYNSGIFGVNIL